MKQLFEPLKIRNLTIQNRVCVPPMVCFNWAGTDGVVTDQNVEHYRAMAAGKPGLIIQEATVVSEEGKLHQSQLGIWSDAHIPGLRKITEAVHAEGCPIFVQIHHAGVVGIAEEPLCPDAYELSSGVTGKKMTLEEIKQVQQAFVDAARRAYQAGYDGVELHGCHRYLICQFLDSEVNRRDDIYGKEPLRFVTEILDGIRATVPDENFVVGIRLGVFEPNLEAALENARELDACGMDFFNMSYGFITQAEATERKLVDLPEGFPFRDVVYAAGEFARELKAPVFAVNGIRTPQDAQSVLDLTGVDMVCVAKSVLVDYNWTARAARGEEPGRCVDCPRCFWYSDHTKCPGRKLLEKAAHQ